MLLLACASSSLAVVYNTDRPSYSAVTGPDGLTDRHTLFLNSNVVYNGSNSTRGTGTYLGNGWVLTARHVIQNGGDYNSFASPNQITFKVNANGITQTYTADQTSGSGNADIALFRLANWNTGPISTLPGVLKSAIYTGNSESSQLVQVGGYGLWGPLGGTINNSEGFHRAFNIASVSGGFVSTSANANTRLVNNGHVLGIGFSGDSGSALWMSLAGDAATDLWDYALIGALATSNGTNFGSTSSYTRVSSHNGWIRSTAYTNAMAYWDANPAMPGIQEGSGVWDFISPTFSNGSDNFAWTNGSQLNAYFGAKKGAAGVVTLGTSVSLQNLIFNAASEGTYTIVGDERFKIVLATGSQLVAYADATLHGALSGGGNINKVGPAMLTLAGSNALVGTLRVGNGATGGGNVNGALRITSASALGNVTTVVLPDNNSAYTALQLDGSSAPITLPSTVTLLMAGSHVGNTIQNVAGNNTINSSIQTNVGGNNYTFRSDAGLLTVNSNFSPALGSTRVLWLTGDGDGDWRGIIGNAVGTTTAINKLGAGAWTLSGASTYSGTTTVNAGSFIVNGSHVGGGAYTVAAGATLAGTGTVDPAGANGITLAGGIAPGASAGEIGTLTVGSPGSPNNVVVAVGGALVAEIGPASQADRLAVSGTLNLNTLGDELRLMGLSGGFDGSEYTIATFMPGTLGGGVFSSVFLNNVLQSTTGRMTNGYELVYDDIVGQIRLVASPSILPGDSNEDGIVDAADYVVWRKNGAPSDEYDLWRENFGRTMSENASHWSMTAHVGVPEPPAIWLIGLVAGAFLRRIRSR